MKSFLIVFVCFVAVASAAPSDVIPDLPGNVAGLGEVIEQAQEFAAELERIINDASPELKEQLQPLLNEWNEASSLLNEDPVKGLTELKEVYSKLDGIPEVKEALSKLQLPV